MTPTQPRREFTKYWRRRLTALLRFARVDLGLLDNGALEKLKGEIYFAVMGEVSPPEDQVFRPIFDDSATREALSEAQRGLSRALQRLLVTSTTAGPLTQFERARFKLAGQELSIGFVKGAFVVRSHTDHFPSQVYKAFTDILKACGLKPGDFRTCSHCETLFIPLRTPHKGMPTYCSQRCAGIVAARMFRKRQAEARLKKKRRKG
jgi:hypothetical protein